MIFLLSRHAESVADTLNRLSGSVLLAAVVLPILLLAGPSSVRIWRRWRAAARPAYLSRIVRASPVVAARWRWAEGLPVEFVSENIAQFGHAARELMRQHQAFATLIHPDDRARVEAELERCLREGDDQLIQEYRIRTDVGTTRWIEARKRCCRDALGKVTHWQGILLDISRRKEVETNLARARDGCRRLFEKLPALAGHADTLGRWDYFNQTWLDFTGRALGQEMGDGWFEAVHPEDRARCQQVCRDAFETGRPFTMEYRLRRADGEYRWLQHDVKPYEDADGRFAGYIGIGHDVTERRQSRENLRQRLAEEEMISLVSAQLAAARTDGLEAALEAALGEVGRFLRLDRCRLLALAEDGQCLDQAYEWCAPGIEPRGTQLRQLEVPRFAWSLNALRQGQPVKVSRIADLPAAADAETDRWTKQGFQSLLMTPVAIAQQWLAVLQAVTEREQRDWTEAEARVLQLLSNVIGQVLSRRRAEDRLRILSCAVEQSPAAIVITDPAGLIEYVNPRFTTLNGYTLEEARGRNPRFLKSGEMPPEEYQRLWQTITRGRQWRGEFHNRKKNGELYWESSSISPILDAAGRITHFLAVKEDITERKQMESALRHSQEHFQNLAEQSPNMIFINQRGKVVYANRKCSEVMGYTREEFLDPAFDFFRLIAPESVEVVRRAYQQHQQRREVPPCEYNLLTKDDRKLNVIIATKLIEHEGQPAILGTMTDITERKQAETERAQMQEQLTQAQKLESIGRLAAGIGHEINTPTQFIGDNTRFLQQSFLDLAPVFAQFDQLLAAAKANQVTPKLIDQVEAALQTADLEFLRQEIPTAVSQSLEGVERVAAIVRAMKEFSHPGSEGKSTINLNRAIESTVTVCRNEWKYVADLKLELDPSLPAVPCLPGEFNQVILNLVINAAHAVGDVVGDGGQGKGTITVSTRRVGDWVEVRIADTGAGIPESIREKIFEPFFTTKEVGKGTGQGLAIARSVIVNKHGGAIDVQSQEGKGTTFILRLPMKAVTGEVQRAAA